MRTRWASLLVFWLVVAGWAPGQEPAAPVEPSPGLAAWFRADFMRLDLDSNTIVARGGVQVRWQGNWLRCDEAVIWGAMTEVDESQTVEQRLETRELYADGNVILARGELVRTIQASSVYIDPVHDRALALDVGLTLRSETRNGMVDLVARARELRQRDRRLFETLDVFFTTNPFVDPGYRIETDRLGIQVDPPGQDPRGLPGETITNVRYELDSSVFFLGDLPIMAAPALAGNTAEDFQYWIIKRVGFDHSSKFGPSGFLDIGTDIEFEPGKKWGDWTLHGQYLGDRGPGVGLDLRYRTEDYRGTFVSFYQRDRGRDRIFPGPSDNDRERVTWRHRHQLPEDIQLDLEVSHISDRGFLPEYYEGEFKSGKEQETLLYLKRSMENRTATLLASTRINEFLDQVEHQPRLGYDLVSEPLVDLGPLTLYYDADFEVSRARRRFDDDTGVPDQDAFRVDLDNRFGLPFFAGPIKVEPFGGFRYSYYSNGRLVDESFDRIGTLYGVRATTQLHRSFDASGGLFELDGLRHIIMPEVEYFAVDQVSHDPSDFPSFDAIDAFSEFEVVRFGLRNRLQTIWHDRANPRVVDVVDLDVEWTLFLDPDRDNFGEAAGNLDVDLLLRFSPRVTLLTDFEYSFRLDELEIFNTTLGVSLPPDLFFALGYRRYVGVNDAVLFQAQWKVSERLTLLFQTGYDFHENDLQDQRLVFRRFGVDWVFEVEISHDDGDSFGAGISFSPRGLFDPRVRARSLRYEPRLAEFGQDLLRR
ncbi:MAG: LPS-assembly protein LptD [Planctomycetes bacterium]|nr:LPS-assembly protein LptD [Planctomycetota bacterium]